MTAKEHANLIGIFSYVFAGIQGLITLFFGVYTLIMAFVFLAAILGEPADTGGVIVTGVFTAIFGIVSALGLTSIVMNLKVGRRLRGEVPPSPRSVKFTAILNICSLFYGGMFALPFGAPLGVYGLWFATSETGRQFFSGLPEGGPTYIEPPPAQIYLDPHAYQSDPYKWR